MKTELWKKRVKNRKTLKQVAEDTGLTIPTVWKAETSIKVGKATLYRLEEYYRELENEVHC